MVVHFISELTILLVVMEIEQKDFAIPELCSILSHGFCFTFLFLLYLTSLFHGLFLLLLLFYNPILITMAFINVLSYKKVCTLFVRSSLKG